MIFFDDLKDIVDDTVQTSTIGHVFKGDFSGNRGRDCCLETFGEETDECRRHNEAFV